MSVGYCLDIAYIVGDRIFSTTAHKSLLWGLNPPYSKESSELLCNVFTSDGS